MGGPIKLIGDQLRLSASDVANFVACEHLSGLDLRQTRGELHPPIAFDLGFQDLVDRGMEHEAEILSRFRAVGHEVVVIPDRPEATAMDATRAAIASGADVIYQGTLLGTSPDGQARLLGRPDFLVRADLLAAPDGELRPPEPHYEVVDAKLARAAKARAVAQTAFYSYLLTRLQGIAPRWMHLALGHGELVPFKVPDYAAYENQTRRLLALFVTDPGEVSPAADYPEPVEHCAICRWDTFCADRRRRDDDLSLIAGISKDQRKALKSAGVTTRRGFAGLPQLPETKVSAGGLARVQLQARLQVSSQDSGRIEYELLDPEQDREDNLVPNRGLLGLPEPSPGDLFFDIEGSRYYSEDNREFGLQYLFGIVDTADRDEHGVPRYTQIWAYDRIGEKQAFEKLIDFITERRARHPDLHVYHYNHYEPTSVDHLTELHGTRQEAVGRLMGRFATREDEVDNLFRLGVFVDLYRLVRQGLRAGVESYSIKRLEPLCGYERAMDLHRATENLIAFETALDDGSAKAGARSGAATVVAAYNEDDCRATLVLRDWLESRRIELAGKLGFEPPRPVPPEQPEDHENPEVAQVRASLLEGVPEDPAARDSQQRARALLADLLEWHRRENKPAWWRYFYLRTLSPAELIGEADTLGGLTGGEVIDTIKRSVVRRFRFPPQEHGFKPRGTALDPDNEDRGWEIRAIDDAQGTIDLKVGATYAGPWPVSLTDRKPIDAAELAARILDLGKRVAQHGVSGRDAGTALLLRLRPDDGREAYDGREADAPLRLADEPVADAAVRLVLGLQGSYLPIQGPPGTGKTFTAARQILELIKAGRTVGITGPSHAVICNLIDKVADRAIEDGYSAPRIGQRADRDNPFLSQSATRMEPALLEAALRGGDLDIGAGTAWFWSREKARDTVDTLFIDEAGQISLANVLAMAGAARNLVLIGDPQQLAQPSQATHPPGAGASALEHILGDQATMPPQAGLLLDQTWRMHPRLCSFTSETFYDGRLTPVGGLERQEIVGSGAVDGIPGGSGLRVVAVQHEDNTNASPEEAARVAELVRDLIGASWQDKHGSVGPITPADVLVVTPYNAQIRAIEEALAAAGCPDGVQVGTVDKFQGREAPVAIYSMASSSADDAPRGMEFLYDPHRLNVATSRAKALAIITLSPALLQVGCKTPRQMYLANALCRAWEASRPS